MRKSDSSCVEEFCNWELAKIEAATDKATKLSRCKYLAEHLSVFTVGAINGFMTSGTMTPGKCVTWVREELAAHKKYMELAHKMIADIVKE